MESTGPVILVTHTPVNLKYQIEKQQYASFSIQLIGAVDVS